MHIEIPYQPRPLQLALHDEMQEKRWVLLFVTVGLAKLFGRLIIYCAMR